MDQEREGSCGYRWIERERGGGGGEPYPLLLVGVGPSRRLKSTTLAPTRLAWPSLIFMESVFLKPATIIYYRYQFLINRYI